MESSITHLLCDNDGVLRREKLIIPGVAEFFSALKKHSIASSVLSNNSRDRGVALLQRLQSTGFEVAESDLPHAISSADATAVWLKENPREGVSPLVYVIGDRGIRDAIQALGIPICEDYAWDGKNWTGTVPTDVVCGFSEAVDYKHLAPGWNAVHQHGARLIATNKDPSRRNEEGQLLPANGASIAFLENPGVKAMDIGKPGILMAEMALKDMKAEKQSARVAVLGDTLEQDVALAKNLRLAGWNVESWVVLTGVLTREEAQAHLEIDQIFEDINEVRERMFA